MGARSQLGATESELRDFSIFAEELAEAAARVILPHFRAKLSVSDKGGESFDPVTIADRAGERVMREMLGRRYPGHGIHGEEEGHAPGTSPYTWFLDPIDGTRSFISGLPLWGTLIAFNDGQRPRVGVMNQPYTDEQFLGTPDGAWLNGRPIAVRPCESLEVATLACTSPQICRSADELRRFQDVADRCRLVRYGGDCYAYCMLACGHIDVVIESGLKPYDIQPLIPIIQGAGGIVSTWTGGDPQQGGAIVACGDRRVHARVLQLLSN